MHGNPDFGLIAENRSGRPKGRKNNRTIEAEEMARKIVEDPVYFENLQARARAGTLKEMEPVLWYYAYGRPATDVTLRLEATNEDERRRTELYDLSDDELAQRAELLADVCRAAAAASAAKAALAEAKEKPVLTLSPIDFRHVPSPSAEASPAAARDERNVVAEPTVLQTEETLTKTTS